MKSLVNCGLVVLCAVSPAPSFGGETLWPWASQNPNPPPKVQPYEIPTFSGERQDFRRPRTPWVKAPKIDTDAIFRAAVACYPARSRWQIDVDLTAALRNQNAIDISGTTIGRSMVGIVAKMPIYSDTEMDRERQREYQRRGDTAKYVASFGQALAKRNQALRILAIASAMEQRAQVRVAEGVAEAEEQIKFLERIGAAEKDLIAAETDAAEARLRLVAACRDDAADTLNAYLTELAQIAESAKP